MFEAKRTVVFVLLCGALIKIHEHDEISAKLVTFQFLNPAALSHVNETSAKL
jgi:hypothetical protein